MIEHVALAVASLACAALTGRLLVLRRRRRTARAPSRRILFPFVGSELSAPVLDSALRLAQAEHAAVIPAYLARVPLSLPLDAPLPRQAAEAIPVLEAVELQARRAGVPVDARIERGRTLRHALRELLTHERHDRLVVAADEAHGGFGPTDVAWLLEHADGEVLVVRPAANGHLSAAPPA